MKYASTLLAACAAGSLLAPIAPAQAATKTVHHRAAHKRAAPPRAENSGVNQELAELRAEVNALHQELASQRQSAATTQTQVAQTEAQMNALHDEVAQAPKAAHTAAREEVAVALDKEHKKGYADFKGLHITPGGFLEMAGIYRQRFQGNDMATSFAIPFPNNRAGTASESRLSARQSRLSFLAQGKVNKDVTLSMYGEFDFLGGAQTANSNESNSFNPRIRHLYGTIDWAHNGGGIHLLAGQNWSLITLNTKGITPRNELTPPQIDAQYIPGFFWARQPQLRLTVDTADHKLWLAVSAENAATTTVGTVPTSLITYNATAGSGFDTANSLSLNGTPDFVGKVAYEGSVAGRSLHVEGFALSRTFTAHLNGGYNINRAGYGFGGGAVFQAVPGKLDLQFSGIVGKGIGRYGSAQLGDVTFDANGMIHPVGEFMLLGGATFHATKRLDLYLFAGKEQETGYSFASGYGNASSTANNAGCFIEGGTCSGNTRRVQQLTTGFWNKLYSGSFGHAQVGLQYAYTQRQLFADANGIMPQVGENIGFLSFRYYPFN